MVVTFASILLVLVAPVVGSFLGVLASRWPEGRQVVWGRSACDACGHALAPRDLVPIASWLFAGGRCRYCRASITALYPGIEFGAFALAIWAAAVTSGALLWASCVLGWALLALATIDARSELLPDALTLPLVALGIAVTYVTDPDDLWSHAIGAVAGYIAFALTGIAYARLRGREGLGRGDAKLLAAAGAWVSWEGLPSVVLIAAGLSLGWLGIQALCGRRLSLASRLPLGPGLCAGTWLVWLYGPLA